MKINEVAKEIHEQAKVAGWYDSPRSPAEYHMLMVSEIAEATEEVRNGGKDYYTSPVYDGDVIVGAKPEGEAVELVDCLIRILDYMEFKGWDIEAIVDRKMKFNKTRPYRHGGKLL